MIGYSTICFMRICHICITLQWLSAPGFIGCYVIYFKDFKHLKFLIYMTCKIWTTIAFWIKTNRGYMIILILIIVYLLRLNIDYHNTQQSVHINCWLDWDGTNPRVQFCWAIFLKALYVLSLINFATPRIWKHHV